jgi:hypothetical protein
MPAERCSELLDVTINIMEAGARTFVSMMIFTSKYIRIRRCGGIAFHWRYTGRENATLVASHNYCSLSCQTSQVTVTCLWWWRPLVCLSLHVRTHCMWRTSDGNCLWKFLLIKKIFALLFKACEHGLMM